LGPAGLILPRSIRCPAKSPFVAEASRLGDRIFRKEKSMATQTYVRSRPPSETTVRAEALLMRYPNLSEEELATLINLFPYIRILDLGLMTSDERLSGKLDAFHRDHGKKLKIPMSSMIAFLAVPTIIVVGGLMWWALGATAGM
jgi:hypothetical protein